MKTECLRRTRMNELIDYYGKYNEEKRLLRPYGRVEYLTSMKYIEEAIGGREHLKIMDVGAATGRYTIPLAEKGHDVTAVELVNYNLGILKQKAQRAGLFNITARQGNALDLGKYPENAYDIVLFMGPMYHLFTFEEKVKALTEARRILKPDGTMFVAYCMNEFGVILYGFREGHAMESIQMGKLTSDFHINNSIEDLFSFDRTEDIDAYNKAAGLKRKKLISADGPANYMRELITDMSEEMFQTFLSYHLSTCERPDLVGAGNHTLDIVGKGEIL